MDLAAFALKHKVNSRRDECGETFIFGKLWKTQPKRDRAYGHHIFEHGDGQFGLQLMFDMHNSLGVGGSGKSAKWINAKKKLVAAGFHIQQDSDAGGIALLNPEDKSQSPIAWKLAGARLRRALTEERRKTLAERLATIRAKKVAWAPPPRSHRNFEL